MPRSLKNYRITKAKKLDLDDFDPAATPASVGGRDDDEKQLHKIQSEIAALQNALFAEAKQSVLLALQGMDTAGKDGVTIATFRSTHPQGVHTVPFRAPSAEESAHDFLWRVHPHAPPKGMITVFNRSHYEAVIAERVLGLADMAECERRYAQIADFERLLSEHGTRIVKCYLHISLAEQKTRLQSRLGDLEKNWKFNPNDLVERGRWDKNMQAYTDAIRFTATKDAPWWIVPADDEPRRDLMVATLVRDALAALAPQYPPLKPEYRSIEIV